MMFGDKDPEDVWDDVDPDDVKLDVLERVITDLIVGARDARFHPRRRDALRLVAKLELTRGTGDPRLGEIRAALEGLA